MLSILTRLVSFRKSLGAAFSTSLFVVVYTTFNTIKKDLGFGFTQGFPLAYTVLGDSAPALVFHPLNLLIDVAIGLFMIGFIWRFVPRHSSRCTLAECITLAIVASSFTWAGLETWYGWRPTIWSIDETKLASVGFPFVVVRDGGSGGEIWAFFANWLTLLVTLAALSKLFHRKQKFGVRLSLTELRSFHH